MRRLFSFRFKFSLRLKYYVNKHHLDIFTYHLPPVLPLMNHSTADIANITNAKPNVTLITIALA